MGEVGGSFVDNDYVNEQAVFEYPLLRELGKELHSLEGTVDTPIEVVDSYRKQRRTETAQARDFHTPEKLKRELKREVDRLVDALYADQFPFNHLEPREEA